MIPLRNIKRFFQKAMQQPGYALKVALKRFNAYRAYNYGNGRSSFPEAVTFFLTHRCNLHCSMCGQWGEGGVTKKQSAQYISQELSREEIFSVIDDINNFKPNITLFGGEPLIYPHTIELIRYIKQKGMHCLMITNGSLLERNAKNIVEAGLDELNVSLDGGSELHDRIRGMPGLFDKIMRGLKEVNRFKEINKSHRPLINLQCTINKQNYQYLEQMIDVTKRVLANSLTFHNLIFLNRQIIEKQKPFDALLECSSSNWEGFVFEPDIDPKALYKKTREILSAKFSFKVDFYPNFSYEGLVDYYNNPNYKPLEYPGRCVSPWIAAYVFPDGEVRPCLNSSFSFGNIREKKFNAIWNSQSAIKFRRLLKDKKSFSACARCTELYRY